MIACAATLWAHGQTTITSAADAAKALGPLAGRFAELIFAMGLLTASLLGLGTVPLTSAYAVTEAFGWESGLDRTWRQAPAFYALLAFFVGFSALFVLIPGLPLIVVMYLSQVFDGILLPFILVFVMLMSRDRRLLGRLRSSVPLYVAGWVVTGLISLLSLALVVSQILEEDHCGSDRDRPDRRYGDHEGTNRVAGRVRLTVEGLEDHDGPGQQQDGAGHEPGPFEGCHARSRMLQRPAKGSRH